MGPGSSPGDGGGCCSTINQTHFRDLAALIARSFADRFALKNSEGAGNAGCALHPRSREQVCTKVRPRAYRAAENTRHSLRNGFTAYGALSPENSSFASVAP